MSDPTLFEHVPTRDGYDRWASVYDGEGNPLVELEAPVAEQMLGEVAGLRIADIGCGTGRHAIRLTAAGAQVTAIDFSREMLTRAGERAAAEHIGSDRLRFIEHDLLLPLPLDDRAFDRVLCCLVMDHIPEPRRMMAELKRICRPDGFVLITVMHPAMMLRGTQARFTDPATGREVRPQSYAHQISDYLNAALRAGLGIEDMKELPADEALAARCVRAAKYIGWPMLLVMKLR